MILKTDITNENFLVYSAQHYDTVFMDDSEFLGDLNRIVCIKKLFNTYLNKKGLKPRLILNHLIILFITLPLVVAMSPPEIVFLGTGALLPPASPPAASSLINSVLL